MLDRADFGIGVSYKWCASVDSIIFGMVNLLFFLLVWESANEQILPMISDVSPTGPSFMDFILNFRINFMKFYDWKWIFNIHAFFYELSQEGDRRSLNQDKISLKEEIDSDAERYSESHAQIKDWRIMSLIDRVLGPAKIDVVCEPHKAQITSYTCNWKAQYVQIGNKFHP